MKLKRIGAGHYVTDDGKYEITTSDGFWYAVDTETGQSVVDFENTMSHIKESLEGFIKRKCMDYHRVGSLGNNNSVS